MWMMTGKGLSQNIVMVLHRLLLVMGHTLSIRDSNQSKGSDLMSRKTHFRINLKFEGQNNTRTRMAR